MKNFRREVNFTKNIYLFITLIATVLFVFFSVITDNIERYKTSNIEMKKDLRVLSSINKNHTSLENDFNKNMSTNKDILGYISRAYSEVEISNILDKYFTSFNVSKSKISTKDKYQMINMKITGKTTSPNNVYSFVKELSKIKGLVEIMYPVEFESKEGYLYVSFILVAYVFK